MYHRTLYKKKLKQPALNKQNHVDVSVLFLLDEEESLPELYKQITQSLLTNWSYELIFGMMAVKTKVDIINSFRKTDDRVSIKFTRNLESLKHFMRASNSLRRGCLYNRC